MSWTKPLLPPQKAIQIGYKGRGADGGLQCLDGHSFGWLRWATIALFAVAGISLIAAPARAFSQESGGASGGNSTFADPDAQVNIFGNGAEAQHYGSNGSVQFGAQQSQTNAFRHFQSDSLTSPPDRLSRPND
jgi:hypothetical protein